MFTDKRINLGYLFVLALLLALLWVPIIAWLASGASMPPPGLGGRDPFKSITSLYYLCVSVPALCLSLIALVYAPLGLVRNADLRTVHFGQLVIGLCLLASLALEAFIVLLSVANPG